MQENKKDKVKNPDIFINRIEESKYLLDYFENKPRNILFLYWPKSTWKTALISKIIKEHLDNWVYAVSFLTMRWSMIRDFKDFRKLFFPITMKWKIRNIVAWINIDLWFFKWSVDDEAFLEENVFALMLKKLRQAKEDWIKTRNNFRWISVS